MIAFGTAVSDQEAYEAIALPSIQRIAEPDSTVLTRHGRDSIQVPYNELLDEAAALPDLEALILLHQDLELQDATLLQRIRSHFAEPETELIGLAGSGNVHSLAWWEHDMVGSSFVPGGPGQLTRGDHQVDAIDGVLLVLSPWAVHNVRFDEAFASDFHGYDVDISFQVRAARRRVVVTDVSYFHHWVKDPIEDRDSWIRNALRLRRKWDRRLWPHAWSP